jgi:phosphoglycolate phosphatase
MTSSTASTPHWLQHLTGDIGRFEGYRVLPGAEQILALLSEAGVLLSLVSGAIEGAARTKLIPADLNRFFLFGAYGSDSPQSGRAHCLRN